MCKHPAIQSKLRTAIELACPKKGHLDVDDVANIPILDGVINEVLRMHPAVSSFISTPTAITTTYESFLMKV